VFYSIFYFSQIISASYNFDVDQGNCKLELEIRPTFLYFYWKVLKLCPAIKSPIDHFWFKQWAMFWASTINSMRISRPPPRFSPDGEEFVAKPRRIKLVPDAGDPERFSKVIRLPELSIRRSKIPKAGRGLFLNEKVQRGQVLTRYRQKIISERRAKELKLQVAQLDFLPIFWQFFSTDKSARRAIGT